MSASIALPIGIHKPAARLPGRWERSLPPRQPFALDTAEPVTVSCLEGMLWLTLDGDPIDYVLAPGQALRVPAGRSVVIQALREARFGFARA